SQKTWKSTLAAALVISSSTPTSLRNRVYAPSRLKRILATGSAGAAGGTGAGMARALGEGTPVGGVGCSSAPGEVLLLLSRSTGPNPLVGVAAKGRSLR